MHDVCAAGDNRRQFLVSRASECRLRAVAVWVQEKTQGKFICGRFVSALHHSCEGPTRRSGVEALGVALVKTSDAPAWAVQNHPRRSVGVPVKYSTINSVLLVPSVI